jgi:putative aldouronate transport system substrate-binding protein
MKRMLSQALVILMVLMFVGGCTTPAANTPAPAKTQEAVATQAPTEAPPEPITFTMYSVETDAYPDLDFTSPVAKEITKATGVTLKIENAISSDAGKQKLSLMAASGEYPDLVYGKGDLGILLNVKGVVKLDELIDQYAPNLKKFYGNDLIRLRWSLDDPSIYYVGGKEVGQENMEPNAGMQLQLKVVKELGYPKMRTLQDFENAIKTYYQAHPTTSDGQKTIPLSLLADDWRFLITVSNPANFATGNSDDGEWYVDPATLQCTRHLARPEDKEYFRWLNHMNDIGLLDPDSFVQKYDDYKAKIASGRVLALADARWEISEPISALKQDGKFDSCYGFFPITQNENQKFADFQSTGYLGGWGLAITTSCKEPVRAMQFLDWMCTEKAQILTHWGIEGVHYDIVDGKRVLKKEVLDMSTNDPAWQLTTGIKKFCYPFPTYGNAVLDSTGQNYEAFDTLDVIIQRQSAIENEVLAGYGVKAWKELYPQSSEFTPKPWGAAWLVNIEDPDWKAADDRILKTGYSMIPQAILCKPAEFDAKWDDYQQALKDAGLDMVTSVFTKALQDRTKLWQ